MRYFCTVYNREYKMGGHRSDFAGAADASPVASIVVGGSNLREAAARAYVQCVGKQRAALLRAAATAPKRIIDQETNPRAIAASLRKTGGRNGQGYELDNFVQGWFITVEPMCADTCLPHSRFRLSLPHLLRLLRSPSPN